MAINRYMKPANQPLLDTYVPLPFKEMSMAYAVQQKEHDDAEVLADSLDDKILKVRASTPLHSKVLTQIRTDLDTELSDLVDKHNGRYADMVPELTKIQTRIAQDFQNGDLGAIKRSTKSYEDKLLKAKQKAEEKGEYSSQFSPVMGGEGAWNYFYQPGYDKDSKSWTFTDDNTSTGYQILGDGRKVLKTYEYTGLHKGAEQLKEANTLTFDKLKPDILAITTENEKTGRKWSQEQKQITLSKIYRAAHNDKDYYSDDFKKELNYIIDNTSDDWIFEAATSAIDNIYGLEESEGKTKALGGLTKDDGSPSDSAKDFAKTSYVGIMGEKYLMSDLMTSDTYDASGSKKNQFGIPRADWIPNVEGDTPLVTAGRPIRLDGKEAIAESGDPIPEYIKVVNANKDAYDQTVADYEAMKASGTMDAEYQEEWDQKINNAEYQYKSASLAITNLAQNAASQLNARKLPNGDYEYVDPEEGGGVVTLKKGDSRIKHNGWDRIQFGEDGTPLSLENAAADMVKFNPWDAKTGFMGRVFRAGDKNSPLFVTMNNIQENFEGGLDGGYFGGRSQSLPTYNTTTSKVMDASIFSNIITTVGEEDFEYNTTSNGQNELGLPSDVTLAQLINADIISKDTVENLDDYVKKALWTAVPNPATSNYQGVISLPVKGKENENATITLFFDAPKEVKQTWSRQGEFEEVDPEDGSVSVITRPRTAPERMLFHDMFNAQLDIQRAISIPGNISMSSYEDSEGSSLGFYYFGETPDGVPIRNEQYVFQPRAGLAKSIDLATGDYIYTTGDEQFNVDSDPTEIAQLIALNDPTQSASKSFWQNQVNDNASNNYPIAIEGRALNETSEARAVDIQGNPYLTQLHEGQMILPDDRYTQQDLDQHSKSHAKNLSYVGLQKPLVDIIVETNEDYTINMNTLIDKQLETLFTNNPTLNSTAVELADGSTTQFQFGNFTVDPIHGTDNGYFTLPLVSGARTYQQQNQMYTDWVEGGKTGDPVANPAVGGFHVMGQAIDVASDGNLYDWVLRAPEEVVSLGGVKPHMISVIRNGNREQVRGFKISELKLGGKNVFPNFAKQSLSTLFERLNSTKKLYTDDEG